jgi:hypothetical protein
VSRTFSLHTHHTTPVFNTHRRPPASAPAPQTTPRTGWVKRGVAQPESIADHMYRMGVMALLVQGTSYDYGRCMKLAIVHDIAECEFSVNFYHFYRKK